jgi:hypothetical protein
VTGVELLRQIIWGSYIWIRGSWSGDWFLKARRYDSRYGRTYYHLGLINFIKGEHGRSVRYYRLAEKQLKETLKYTLLRTGKSSLSEGLYKAW